MPPPAFPSLDDFTSEELIFVADDHDDKAFGLLIEKHPAMKQGVDFYDFLSGLNNPFGNMIFGMRVPDPPQTVASITERLKKSGAPAYWWIGPCTTPVDLDKLLLDHGWKDAGTAPCMAIDLDKLDDPRIEGLELSEVTTSQQLSDWQELFSRGYEVPLDVARVLAPTLDGRMRLFTGLLHGEPVATTGIFVLHGVPGIYCVSTLPEYRGRGLGAAITALPLIAARAQGYRMGTLQASTMGYPVYKRIGFQDVCSLRIFGMNLLDH